MFLLSKLFFKKNIINIGLLILFGLLITTCGSAENQSHNINENMEKAIAKETNFKKPSKEELKKLLTPKQFEVTQSCGTEAPFQNEYWNHKADGIYVDIISGEALFSSKDKYDSGSGWPSFTKPIEKQNILELKDTTYGMIRTEVKSKNANSHLGHVFPDGPGPEGTRYCINSASLKFIPVSELEEKGYGEYLKLFKDTQEIAYLAGGCFWGMEELIRKLPGIISIDAGYSSSNFVLENENLVPQKIKPAESVKITFNSKKLSYEDLLRFYFKIHDPTTLNRQGNDIGEEYRSSIFYITEEQKNIAKKIMLEVTASKKWPKPISTKIEKLDNWKLAEEFHQDYLQKNPGGYTCHYIRE